MLNFFTKVMVSRRDRDATGKMLTEFQIVFQLHFKITTTTTKKAQKNVVYTSWQRLTKLSILLAFDTKWCVLISIYIGCTFFQSRGGNKDNIVTVRVLCLRTQMNMYCG